MRKIMVANPKGGSGKSSLAIHLASWFAQNGNQVCLGDLDRQQSSRQWLAQRPLSLRPIKPWDIDETLQEPAPAGCAIAIIDTPAGLHGKSLKRLLAEVDRVVVPVTPSRFDMLASSDFFDELAQIKAVRKERVGVAIVGMRVDLRTQASQQLIEFLQQFELPLVTCIRHAQRYVQAVESGSTLFDSNETAAQDRRQWQPLLEWLQKPCSTAQRLATPEIRRVQR